ncbi:MAG: hypothetical protein RMJ98_12325 [Myxococcales bacterium]|nr:hypothetical protein [Polyangiaceae bacterium]MDW8250074.1 hypothetical protein [Myxococcales bacterium]
MARLLDGISVLLLLLACGSFMLGLRSLSAKKDLHALYALAVGGLALKASVDLLRSKGS